MFKTATQVANIWKVLIFESYPHGFTILHRNYPTTAKRQGNIDQHPNPYTIIPLCFCWIRGMKYLAKDIADFFSGFYIHVTVWQLVDLHPNQSSINLIIETPRLDIKDLISISCRFEDEQHFMFSNFASLKAISQSPKRSKSSCYCIDIVGSLCQKLGCNDMVLRVKITL